MLWDAQNGRFVERPASPPATKSTPSIPFWGRVGALALPSVLSGGKRPFPLATNFVSMWDPSSWNSWRDLNPEVFPAWRFHASAPTLEGVVHVGATLEQTANRMNARLVFHSSDGGRHYFVHPSQVGSEHPQLAMALDSEGYATFFDPAAAFPALAPDLVPVEASALEEGIPSATTVPPQEVRYRPQLSLGAAPKQPKLAGGAEPVGVLARDDQDGMGEHAGGSDVSLPKGSGSKTGVNDGVSLLSGAVPIELPSRRDLGQQGAVPVDWEQPVTVTADGVFDWTPQTLRFGGEDVVVFHNPLNGETTRKLLVGDQQVLLTASVAPSPDDGTPHLAWHISNFEPGDLGLPKTTPRAPEPERRFVHYEDGSWELIEKDQYGLERVVGSFYAHGFDRSSARIVSGSEGRRFGRGDSNRGSLTFKDKRYDFHIKDGAFRVTVRDGDPNAVGLLAALDASPDVAIKRIELVQPDGTSIVALDRGSNVIEVTAPFSNGKSVAEQHPIVAELTKAACFAAGTLVHTASGPQPIEAIQPGDLVWARDDRTFETSLKPVLRTFAGISQPVLKLHLRDANGTAASLETTAAHPFWVQGKGWVASGELEPGDVLAPLAEGTSASRASIAVAVVSLESATRRARVYNFQVAEARSYFVGALPVWVHNTSSIGGEGQGGSNGGNGPRDDAPEVRQVGLAQLSRVAGSEPERWRLVWNGVEVWLPRAEGRILDQLMSDPERTHTQEELFASYSDEDPEGRSYIVENHMANLRRRVDAAVFEAIKQKRTVAPFDLVSTVRDVGYEVSQTPSATLGHAHLERLPGGPRRYQLTWKAQPGVVFDRARGTTLFALMSDPLRVRSDEELIALANPQHGNVDARTTMRTRVKDIRQAVGDDFDLIYRIPGVAYAVWVDDPALRRSINPETGTPHFQQIGRLEIHDELNQCYLNGERCPVLPAGGTTVVRLLAAEDPLPLSAAADRIVGQTIDRFRNQYGDGAVVRGPDGYRFDRSLVYGPAEVVPVDGTPGRYRLVWNVTGPRDVELRPDEGPVLAALLRAPQEVVPHATLFRGYSEEDLSLATTSVNHAVARLRRKIAKAGGTDQLSIRTVQGAGYTAQDRQPRTFGEVTLRPTGDTGYQVIWPGGEAKITETQGRTWLKILGEPGVVHDPAAISLFAKGTSSGDDWTFVSHTLTKARTRLSQSGGDPPFNYELIHTVLDRGYTAWADSPQDRTAPTFIQFGPELQVSPGLNQCYLRNQRCPGFPIQGAALIQAIQQAPSPPLLRDVAASLGIGRSAAEFVVAAINTSLGAEVVWTEGRGRGYHVTLPGESRGGSNGGGDRTEIPSSAFAIAAASQGKLEQWGDGLVQLGVSGSPGTDVTTFVADQYLAEGAGLKPTLASFRADPAGIADYFVRADGSGGFALKPWREVDFSLTAVSAQDGFIVRQGTGQFSDGSEPATKVDKTFVHVRDAEGNVRILAHHSSLPPTDEALALAATDLWPETVRPTITLTGNLATVDELQRAQRRWLDGRPDIYPPGLSLSANDRSGFRNDTITVLDDVAFVQGYTRFYGADGAPTMTQHTLVFARNEQGVLEVVANHFSVPYTDTPLQKFPKPFVPDAAARPRPTSGTSEPPGARAERLKAAIPDKDYGVSWATHVMPFEEGVPSNIDEILLNRPPGIHIGTAGLMNFEYVGPEGAIFFDNNSAQAEAWDAVLTALKGSDTRQEFVDAMTEAAKGLDMRLPWENLQLRLQEQVDRAEGWLGSNERYAVVRDAARQGLLHFVMADVSDAERWRQIGSWIQSEGLSVSTVYFSNLYSMTSSVFDTGFNKLTFLNVARALDPNGKPLIVNGWHNPRYSSWPYLDLEVNARLQREGVQAGEFEFPAPDGRRYPVVISDDALTLRGLEGQAPNDEVARAFMRSIGLEYSWWLDTDLRVVIEGRGEVPIYEEDFNELMTERGVPGRILIMLDRAMRDIPGWEANRMRREVGALSNAGLIRLEEEITVAAVTLHGSDTTQVAAQAIEDFLNWGPGNSTEAAVTAVSSGVLSGPSFNSERGRYDYRLRTPAGDQVATFAAIYRDDGGLQLTLRVNPGYKRAGMAYRMANELETLGFLAAADFIESRLDWDNAARFRELVKGYTDAGMDRRSAETRAAAEYPTAVLWLSRGYQPTVVSDTGSNDVVIQWRRGT